MKRSSIAEMWILIKNEAIKFFSSRMMFAVFIFLVAGVFIMALSLKNSTEAYKDKSMDTVQLEYNEINDILENSGMSDEMREYYTNQLEVKKYMLEHNITPIQTHSVAGLFQQMNKAFALVVIITILGAGNIFSGEYASNVASSLFCRPYGRTKIFAAKFFTLIVFCISVITMLYVAMLIVGGVSFGFGSLKDTIVSYSNGVQARSVLGQSLYQNFFNFFTLLACSSIALMISIICKNGVLSTCTSILLYLMGSSVVLSLNNYNFLRYSLLANIQFQIYQDGMVIFEGMNEWFSVEIIMLHVVLFCIISVLILHRRNID